MRKGLNKGRIAGLILAMALFSGGCGTAYSESAAADVRPDVEYYDSAEMKNGFDESAEIATDGLFQNTSLKTGSGAEEESNVTDSRKLIRTVDLEVETRDYESMLAALKQSVNAYHGYIESMNCYQGNDPYYGGYVNDRYASFTVRIPKDELDDFIESVGQTGHIVRHDENLQDVTLNYVDTDSRKKALEVEQQRLLELLEEAAGMDEILMIEDRLSDVRYQLESTATRLRTLDNQIDYSSVNLHISEVKELSPVEDPGVVERITKGFRHSVQQLMDDAVDLFIWFIVKLPYIILWGIVIIFIILLWRRIRKKKASKCKKQKSNEMASQIGNQIAGENTDK